MYLIKYTTESYSNPYGSIIGTTSYKNHYESAKNKESILEKIDNLNNYQEVSEIEIYKKISLKEVE
jgi:hypothetical protein